jgi:hypothetical protein
MSLVGDLGRRVGERRHELGLTVEEVAARAGMDPNYLFMVEGSSAPQLSRSALWRLAAALDSSVDVISGSGMVAPPGRGRPQGRPLLEPLAIDECRALVAPGGIGRIVFVDADVPVVMPVNFRVLGDDIIFRTESASTVLAHLLEQNVSFEVDHLDEALIEGWSVLISGKGRVVVDPTERELVKTLDVSPWAGGERDTFVRLVPDRMTGRRIRRRSGDG